MIKITPAEIVVLKFIGKNWTSTTDIKKFRGTRDEGTRVMLKSMEYKGLIKCKYVLVNTLGGKQLARLWHKV